MSSDENEERNLKKLTVRELRTKAVKALGSKVAAGLKLKQELVDALVETAAKVVKKNEPAKVAKKLETKKVETKKAEPKKVEPKKVEVKKFESKKAPTKKAQPKRIETDKVEAKRSPPPAKKKALTPVKTAAVKRAEPEKAPTPPRMTKPPKAEVAAEVYELPITRDFFVDPRKPSLPASYGDDRLLCFRREPLAIVVSWDLSAATFEDGQGLSLELVTLEGKLVGSVPVTAPTGLATFDDLPGGALAVQVVRRGRVMTRGRPFTIGSAREASPTGTGAWQMTVPIDEPLPEKPEAREWPDAPSPPASPRAKMRPGSSRLSS